VQSSLTPVASFPLRSGSGQETEGKTEEGMGCSAGKA